MPFSCLRRGWRKEGLGARRSFTRQKFRLLLCHFSLYALPQVSEGGRRPGIPKESRKSLPGPSGPGSKKCPKQSRSSLRSLNIDYFETPETVLRLFRTLFGPRGLPAPGDSFETLSGFRARRVRETPVRGGRG